MQRLERSSRSASGYKYVSLKKGVWHVNAPFARAKGFQSAQDAAEFVATRRDLLANKTTGERPARSAPAPPIPAPPDASKRWWEKTSVRVKPVEVQRMELFGIRLEMKTIGTFQFAPTNRAQVVNELQRLTGRPSTEATPYKTLRTELKDELLHLASPHFDATTLPMSLKRKRALSASDTEALRSMSIPELYALLRRAKVQSELWCPATVIGYFPCTQEHLITYDDSKMFSGASSWRAQPHDGDAITIRMDLTTASNWRRIAWGGNALDPSHPEGEHQGTPSCGIKTYGPQCPRCFDHLGVGAEAWTRCVSCFLMEPGAMWSKRFKTMRDDPNAWQQARYVEVDSEDDR